MSLIPEYLEVIAPAVDAYEAEWRMWDPRSSMPERLRYPRESMQQDAWLIGLLKATDMWFPTP